MKNLAYFFRYRIKNPFRRIVIHYVRYKKRSLHKNGILSYTYQDSEFTIHYYKGGKGPVLLFLHGFALDAVMNWGDILLPFSQHFTVIAPDLLWFGKSNSKQPATLFTQRTAIERLLNDLNIQDYSVIGQSYGGFLAVDLALKQSEKIRKLCIANSPGPSFDESTLQPLLKKHQLSKISDLFVMDSPLDIRLLLHVASYKRPYFPEFVLKQLYQLYFSQNHSQWRSLLDTLSIEKKRIESLDPLKKIDTVLVWSEEDELFILQEGEKFAGLIKAPMIIIPNSGHAPQIDEPGEFIKVLKQFFIEDHFRVIRS